MKYLRKLCILGALCATVIHAQTVSPLKEATADLFGSASDNITSTTGWSTIFFDKTFITAAYGYVRGQNDSTGTGTLLDVNVLNAAAMFNIGKSKVTGGKIGFSYAGALAGDFNFSSQTTGSKSLKKNTVPSFHKVGFLVGLPGNKFGLRIGFDLGGVYDNVQQKPNTETSKVVNSLSFKPSLAFGGYFSTLSRHVFTPTVEAALLITNGGGSAAGAYSSGSVKGTGSDGKPYEDTRVYRKYTPSAKIGLGVGFPSKMGIVSWNVGAQYSFLHTYMPIKFERHTISGITTEAVYRPDCASVHNLCVQVLQKTTLSWRCTLRAAAALSLHYSYNLSGGSIKHTLTSKPAAQTTETQEFFLAPNVRAGVLYKITDNVSWFGAIDFRPFAYTALFEKRYDEKITVDDKADVKDNKISKPLLTHVGSGFLFTLSPELNLSAAFALKLSEKSSARTVQDILGSNIRLSLTWKDALKQ